MKSLFCRINLSEQVIQTENFKKSVLELSQYENISQDIILDKNKAFGHIEFHNNKTTIFNNDFYIILSDCRIDNKQELSDKLNIKTITEDELLIETFKKWDTDCPNYLLGDFAFLIWNKLSQEIFCARDHFGIKPLYYYFDDNTLIVSSEIKAILAQEDLTFTINEQYLADTLSIIKSEHDQTNYNEIKKLPPAHSIHLKNTHLEIKKYWELRTQKQLEQPDEEIISQFKELVFKSVQNRIHPEQNIGTELSGGLDSSSIAAIASSFTSIKSFSHILPDEFLGKIHPFKDEREFINQLCNYCKIEDSHFITSKTFGVFNVLNTHIRDFKYISQQSFSTFSDHLYNKANQEGVSVLLSGFGGDEVITSKSGNYLDELARSGKWKDLKIDLKESKLTKVQYFKSLFKYILKFKFTPIFQFITSLQSNKKWWEEKLQYLAINKDFSNKMNIIKRYYQYYLKINPQQLQERNIERITHPHVAQRLEYCNTSARKYGIEYRYPFINKQLIEFYLSMPPRLKARNGIKRFAIREAMKGILPETIRLRNDKSGATIPTVYMRFVKDQDKIEAFIQKAKTNPIITRYIDIKEFELWFKRTKNRSTQKEITANPGAFYSYLKLMLFIQKNPNLFE